MLLFDLTSVQAFGSIKKHGGGKYAEIIFFKLIDKGIHFGCYYDSKREIDPEILKECAIHNIMYFDINEIGIEKILERGEYSHIFSPMYGTGLSNIHCRKIITIHGLRVLECPTDTYIFKYKLSTKRFLIEKLISFFPKKFKNHKAKFFNSEYFADKDIEIITVSNHSKNALLCYFPKITNNNIKVHVCYSPSTTHTLINHQGKRDNYILMVSGNRWIKNTYRAIVAFDRLKDLGLLPEKKMIITGMTDNSIKYDFKHPDDFKFLGYVDEHKLEELYSKADLFLYPSLNEGFGYPPLEAMKYGTPVIASCFTSIPEVCGDAAMYFNPLSIEEIMNRIIQMQDQDNIDLYSSRAIERYKYIKKRQDEDLDKLIDIIK